MAMLKSSFTFITLIFIFFPCFACSRGIYQYFQLVQQWPPNVCFKRQKRPCYKPPPESLSIHGLWPSNFSFSIANYRNKCPGTAFVDQMSKNQTMLRQLTNAWPDVINGNETKFWNDEWDSHGKCSDQTLDEKQYFQRSYDIWEQFDITPILKRAGIKTGLSDPQPCNLAKIESDIKALTGAKPGLRCRLVNHPPPGIQKLYVRLLYEIAICYDYTGKNLIPCSSSGTTSKCTGQTIYC